MTVYSSVVLLECRKEQRSDTLRNKSHDVITHEPLCKTTTPNTTTRASERNLSEGTKSDVELFCQDQGGKLGEDQQLFA